MTLGIKIVWNLISECVNECIWISTLLIYFLFVSFRWGHIQSFEFALEIIILWYFVGHADNCPFSSYNIYNRDFLTPIYVYFCTNAFFWKAIEVPKRKKNQHHFSVWNSMQTANFMKGTKASFILEQRPSTAAGQVGQNSSGRSDAALRWKKL